MSPVGEGVPGKNIKCELCSTDICVGEKNWYFQTVYLTFWSSSEVYISSSESINFKVGKKPHIFVFFQCNEDILLSFSIIVLSNGGLYK